MEVKEKIDNPNIEKVDVEFTEKTSYLSPERALWKARHDGETSVNLYVTVYFKNPVLLYAKRYVRVEYVLDSVANDCLATFFAEDGEKLPFYPMARARFERLLHILSYPEDGLTEREAADRKRYEEV